MCVYKNTFNKYSLIVKRQQNKIELVTIPRKCRSENLYISQIFSDGEEDDELIDEDDYDDDEEDEDEDEDFDEGMATFLFLTILDKSRIHFIFSWAFINVS